LPGGFDMAFSWPIINAPCRRAACNLWQWFELLSCSLQSLKCDTDTSQRLLIYECPAIAAMCDRQSSNLATLTCDLTS